jgi:hypothetical protein
MSFYLLAIIGVIAYIALLLTALLSAATKTTDYFLYVFLFFFIALCIGSKIFFSSFVERKTRYVSQNSKPLL